MKGSPCVRFLKRNLAVPPAALLVLFFHVVVGPVGLLLAAHVDIHKGIHACVSCPIEECFMSKEGAPLLDGYSGSVEALVCPKVLTFFRATSLSYAF